MTILIFNLFSAKIAARVRPGSRMWKIHHINGFSDSEGHKTISNDLKKKSNIYLYYISIYNSFFKSRIYLYDYLIIVNTSENIYRITICFGRNKKKVLTSMLNIIFMVP